MELARLLIFAQERLLGRGLASLLCGRFDTHTIESFERAGRLLGTDRVEIALWLGDRLDAETVDRIAQLKWAHPDLRLCLIASTADADALRVLLAHNPYGVAVLLRSGDLDVGDVLVSINEILTGRATLESSVLERLLEDRDDDDALTPLSPAEQEVLEMVAFGLRNGEIARRVWKSQKAVEKQVSHVFEKLGLDKDCTEHLDRRVTAARIFFSCRPERVPCDDAVGRAPLH